MLYIFFFHNFLLPPNGLELSCPAARALAHPLSHSLALLATASKDLPAVRVAAIQPGYDKPAFQDSVNTSQVRMDAFAVDVRDAATQGAKVIYTPEMMFNFDPQVDFTDELRLLAAETGAYLFLDYTVAVEGQEWRNESILLSPSGEFSQVYGKNKNPPGEPPIACSSKPRLFRLSAVSGGAWFRYGLTYTCVLVQVPSYSTTNATRNDVSEGPSLRAHYKRGGCLLTGLSPTTFSFYIMKMLNSISKALVML